MTGPAGAPHGGGDPPTSTADLVADVRAALASGGTAPVEGVAPWLPAHIAARTRFIDDRVQDALAAGVDQIVLVGAGFDDRPRRLSGAGVTSYVLDRPDVLDERRRRFGDGDGVSWRGTVPVSVDLATDDVGAVLAAAGYRRDRPATVVVEGVLVYLPVGIVGSVLRALATGSAPGSVLLATLAVHPPGLDSATVLRVANARRLRGEREPWRTILPAVEHLGVVAGAGWRIEEVRDDADIVPGARRGWSRLVAARRGPQDGGRGPDA